MIKIKCVDTLVEGRVECFDILKTIHAEGSPASKSLRQKLRYHISESNAFEWNLVKGHPHIEVLNAKPEMLVGGL